MKGKLQMVLLRIVVAAVLGFFLASLLGLSREAGFGVAIGAGLAAGAAGLLRRRR